MPPTNIEITSLSSESVASGSTLTFYGDNMSATDVAYFTPTLGLNKAAVAAPGISGGPTTVTVTVPNSLGAGAYSVYLATSMGNGNSPAIPLTVCATSMGNGITPSMAVVDAGSMGGDNSPAEAVAGVTSDSS